jgi:hypothetical protein
VSGISIPIIDLLEHPPIGALFRTAVPGNPQAGPFIALAPASASLFKVYGVCLRVHTVGSFHGRDVSFPIVFDPPLGRMCCSYQDASGFGVVQQVENWTFDNQWYVWNEPLPSLWNIYLQPDVVADLFWLGTPL